MNPSLSVAAMAIWAIVVFKAWVFLVGSCRSSVVGGYCTVSHDASCDISDHAESLCRIQHEKAEREKEPRNKAKLTNGISLSDSARRLSTNETHVVPANDEVHQTIDEDGSTIGNEKIIAGQIKETLDNEWKMVSRHENARKRLAKIGAERARD